MKIKFGLHIYVLIKETKERIHYMEILKVSSKSNPNLVAGALAGVINEQKEAELQAVGAGAVNQAVKAIAIARGFLAPSGIELVCVPNFAEVLINEDVRTAIRLQVSVK